jgi:hypothetical protein
MDNNHQTAALAAHPAQSIYHLFGKSFVHNLSRIGVVIQSKSVLYQMIFQSLFTIVLTAQARIADLSREFFFFNIS